MCRTKSLALQLSAIAQMRWVSKSRVVWLTLEEMPELASLRAHP
jgi:hypothetical protein